MVPRSAALRRSEILRPRICDKSDFCIEARLFYAEPHDHVTQAEYRGCTGYLHLSKLLDLSLGAD